MKKNLLVEIQYLPCLEYFYHILRYENVYIESRESFQKQSYRNRCRILGANKVENLTVPVMKRGHGVLIREVEIDYTQNWVNIHLRSLESAYRNAPYFEYYQDYFWKVFKKKHRYLFDLNLELMTVCLQLLGIKKKIELTADFVREADEQTDDVRSLIHPKRTNPRGYITWPAYTQVFGSEFVSNLSILDLLFNEGPDSVKLLARGESLIK